MFPKSFLQVIKMTSTAFLEVLKLTFLRVSSLIYSDSVHKRFLHDLSHGIRFFGVRAMQHDRRISIASGFIYALILSMSPSRSIL